MLECWKKASCKAKVLSSLALIVLLATTYLVGSHGISIPFRHEAASHETVEKPYEFLYIDTNRVIAYLAQVEKGSSVKERLSAKVTSKAGGEASLEGVVKAEASSEDENFVEREVTPTAASTFIVLEEKLSDAIETGLVHRFGHFAKPELSSGEEKENEKLEEGDFVTFTVSVHLPIYTSPYVEVHHAATLAALFPAHDRTKAALAGVVGQRRAARRFETQVGRTPASRLR